MRALLIALLALALPGCSLFTPKFEKPTVSVTNVQLLKSDLWHQELKVRLRVQNPNPRALPVKAITYVLALDGQEFAHGATADSFIVPALGEAEFDLSVSANMASALIKLLGQGGNPVEYQISGRISLSAGLLRSLSFDDRGTFRWQ